MSDIITGKVLDWNMNERSGSRIDSIGSNNLTDNNSVLFRNGIQGIASSFVAANLEDLSIADNAVISPTVSAIWSFWVFLDTLTGNHCFVRKGTSLQVCYTDDANLLSLQMAQSDTTQKAILGVTIAAGVWNHIVFMIESGFLRGYLNKVPTSTTAFDDTILDNTDALHVGSNGVGASHLDGGMDAMKLFTPRTFVDDPERQEFVNTLFNDVSSASKLFALGII